VSNGCASDIGASPERRERKCVCNRRKRQDQARTGLGRDRVRPSWAPSYAHRFVIALGSQTHVSLPAAAPLAAPYQIAFVSSSPQARFAPPGRSESHTTQRRREDQTSSPSLSRDQKSTRRLSLTWGLGSARPCSLPCLGSGQRVASPSRQMALRMGLQRAAAVTAAERSLCKASTTRGTHPEG
jgi:hypothetical protein